MNKCKKCDSKKFVLSFNSYDGLALAKDTYCIDCILNTMVSLFADQTEEIIKDFFEAKKLEDIADLKRSEIAFKVKNILLRDHMTLDEAKEFVNGVSYKAPSNSSDGIRDAEK